VPIVRDERFRDNSDYLLKHILGFVFVNLNIWHLICKKFNLKFICDTVRLYVCVCAFSLRREYPNMILEDKPLISEVVLSQLVPEQDWSKTHTKASKNRNNIFGEERLAHIMTLVVSLGGKLTYVLIYATMELHQRRYVVIFLECLSYFIVDVLILLFVTFVELLGLVYVFFCCLWIFLVVCV
jgi:hypothetical protein